MPTPAATPIPASPQSNPPELTPSDTACVNGQIVLRLAQPGERRLDGRDTAHGARERELVLRLARRGDLLRGVLHLGRHALRDAPRERPVVLRLAARERDRRENGRPDEPGDCDLNLGREGHLDSSSVSDRPVRSIADGASARR